MVWGGVRVKGSWGRWPWIEYLAELGPRLRFNQTHSNLPCPSSVIEASEHLRQKVLLGRHKFQWTPGLT